MREEERLRKESEERAKRIEEEPPGLEDVKRAQEARAQEV